MTMDEPTAPTGHRLPRRILLASTLTVHSDRALGRAVQLARASGALLRVVHAVEPGLLPESYVIEAIDRARRDAARDLAECAPELKGATADILVGEPADAILEDARAGAADVIVMGLSRETTLARAVRGTTTAQVARRASCPVLAVKRRPVRPYERILVALDLRPASVAALDWVLAAFPAAALTVVHVPDHGRPDAEAAEEVASLVAARRAARGTAETGVAPEPAVVIAPGPTALGLPEAIEDVRPDLVAIGTHGRTGIAGFFLGSVAEALLDTLPHDFLIARARG